MGKFSYECSNAFLSGRIFLCFLLLFTLVVLPACADSAKDAVNMSENGNSWEDKISTDLLQIIDRHYCSPGKTPDNAIAEMAIFGQVRYDNGGRPLVLVSVEIVPDMNLNGTAPEKYLNDISVDRQYNKLMGWIYTDRLKSLANLAQVKEVKSVLPPVSASIGVNPIFVQKPVSMSDSSWERKLSTDLLQIINCNYCSPGQTSDDVISDMVLMDEIRYDDKGLPQVHVSARLVNKNSIRDISGYFMRYDSDEQYCRVEGWVSPDSLQPMAGLPYVKKIQTILPPVSSSIVTEGDELLNASTLREMTGFSGKGIKIGIISDGVDNLEDVVAAGELPDDVVVLRNIVGGIEGVAMLEIVHDIAPEAELCFHDRGMNPVEFVHAVDSLISEGCRVICDDISYMEPFFEDGYIAQNIRDRILSYGIVYVTSAGNSALEHYQGDFCGYDVRGYEWHDFSEGSSYEKDLRFNVPGYCAGHVVLQWGEMFGRSKSNYDLFLYDENGHEIGRSVNVQDGEDDPAEWCRFVNTDSGSKEISVRVVKAGGEGCILELYVFPIGGENITVDPNTVEDSLYSQQAVPEVISVAAVNLEDGEITAQPYSSKGPVTIIYPEPEIRWKPDISAFDCVSVSRNNIFGSCFSGTSASAPHVAAICGLLWSGYPECSGDEIRGALLASAKDVGEEGWDCETGYGVADAVLMLNLIPPSLPYECIENSTQRQELFMPPEVSSDYILLYNGWNLVSLPCAPAKGCDISEIFSCVDTKDHAIWWFDSDSGWSAVRVNQTIKPGESLWIYSSDFCRVPISSLDNEICSDYADIELGSGWNCLGVYGSEQITADQYLNSLGKNWSHLMTYDAPAQCYRTAIVNNGEGPFSDKRLLYPTSGFWIYMNNPANFTGYINS